MSKTKKVIRIFDG